MNKELKSDIDFLKFERGHHARGIEDARNRVRQLELQLDGLVEYLEVEMIHHPAKSVFEKKPEVEQA